MPSELPQQNTTAFLDELRTAQISHLLVAAVVEYDIGTVLANGPLTFAELRDTLNLKARPAIVLLTALRSIGLIDVHVDGRVGLTEYGQEKMDPNSAFHLRGYIGLGGFSSDVQHMISCLREDRPAGNVSFVFHDDGTQSALDDPATSDLLTRAMADRARNVAPILAQQLDVSAARHLIDVGGGHGLYSLALLERNPQLQATIIDRAPALKVAREYAEAAGLADRVHLLCGDAHTAAFDQVPDVVLLANLLHDYNSEDAKRLVLHFAEMLPTGERLLVLDSLLNAVAPGAPPISDGPRPVAAYSALLFSICEGRCYRRDEIETWFQLAGLRPDVNTIALPAHGSLVTGWKTG